MKIRHGFVTNSSSSSYIIAYKDVSKIETKDESAKDYLYYISNILDNYLNNGSIDCNKRTYSYDDNIVSEKEIFDMRFRNRYIYGNRSFEEYFEIHPEMKKIYDNGVNYIKNGYKIIFREIENYDTETIKFINDLSKTNYVVILAEDY